MSTRRRRNQTSEATNAEITAETDQVEFHFAKEIKLTLHKSRIIYEKLNQFIEERLRFIHTFNYPYEVFYDDRNGKEQVINSAEVDPVKSIKEVLESEEGKYVDAFYFVSNTSISFKTWIYYNVDFISFLTTLIFILGVIFFERLEIRMGLYISGGYLMMRMSKHVEFPVPRGLKKIVRAITGNRQ